MIVNDLQCIAMVKFIVSMGEFQGGERIFVILLISLIYLFIINFKSILLLKSCAPQSYSWKGTPV